jgi:hypothetical protein
MNKAEQGTEPPFDVLEGREREEIAIAERIENRFGWSEIGERCAARNCISHRWPDLISDLGLDWVRVETAEDEKITFRETRKLLANVLFELASDPGNSLKTIVNLR